MSTFLKVFCGIFIFIGLAISVCGVREIARTMNMEKDSKEHIKGVFIGYETRVFTSKTRKEKSVTVNYYPQFEFTTKDGVKHQVTESKPHILRLFKPGQEIEVIVSPYGAGRIAGFHSLYFLDLSILLIGLLFILVPLLFWKFAIHSIETDKELSRQMNENLKAVLNSKALGPISVGAILKGFIIFSMVVFIIGVGIEPAAHFIKNISPGWRLMKALQKGDYEEARELILKREGINKID